VEFEKARKHKDAFEAFRDAAESGNGLAQRKLGQIYDSGTPAVKRDFQASIMWYQKAREQGVEIPKPINRMER
jgi:TPR repeat protein